MYPGGYSAMGSHTDKGGVDSSIIASLHVGSDRTLVFKVIFLSKVYLDIIIVCS